MCTLISGNVNETDLEVKTPVTTEAMVDTTTATDTLTTSVTRKPPPETVPVTMKATTIQPTEPEPSTTTSMYFELNGNVYPNNSVISLSEVGENENALCVGLTL